MTTRRSTLDSTGSGHAGGGAGSALSAGPGLGDIPPAGRDAVARALAVLEDGVLSRDAAEATPRDMLRGLLAAGIGVARLPVSHGGWGLSLPAHIRLLIEVARVEPAAVQALRSHYAFLERTLRADPATRPDRWIAEAAAGRMFAGATTEPPGQVAGALGTTVRRDDDAGRTWRLDGAKAYCTGALYADWLTVLAAADGRPGERCSVMVRTDQAGVRLADDWAAFGQRASASGGAVFENVRVDAAEVRPVERASGLPQPLNDALLQLTHLATLTGILVRVHDDAVQQARTSSRHFSHAAAATPAQDPVVQQLIGLLGARVATATVLSESAAAVLEDAFETPDETRIAAAHRQVTRAQVIIPDLVLDSASRAFDIGGGSLVGASRRWDRHWRNARTLASHNPAVQKARVLGAEALLDEPLPGIWYAGEPGRAPSAGERREGSR
ncbi:acyl-CoA dehydrogenase family protein [Sediminivirga luteola]|uniref:acyl-CoA dehydrogenase family protein n=1 Tax=Sediminivirga luteola TaxID=1774748 RepID=UPI001F56456A|nr:acyl-CoA dehydrogenase family protein [Sediminivirga luteola]